MVIGHRLLTFLLFKICMTDFLLQNTQKKILDAIPI